jgi:xanthine dehydrogenase molybdenum-binding subunit
VVAANDAGRIINPLGFASQVEGGVIMGIGHALMEDFKVDEGVIKSDRIARYDVPRMQDLPEITSIIVESRTSEGPFGAKGVGELVCVPTPQPSPTPSTTPSVCESTACRDERKSQRLAGST